jgi:hypothetical protein
MAEYRADFLGNDGHIISQSPLNCVDDAEAIGQAKQLVGGYAIELWSGERLVVRLERKQIDGDAGKRSVDKFIERLGGVLNDMAPKK